MLFLFPRLVKVVTPFPHPPLSAEEEAKRTYRTLGRKTLDPNEEWTDLTDVDDPDAAGWRFFKVKVEMK